MTDPLATSTFESKMKVILSGSTGYIGNGVLTHLLTHDSVTHITLLVRRPPTSEAVLSNPKVKLITMEGFTTYPADIASEIATADAAVWCLGTFHGDEKVDIDYPVAFIDVVKASLSRSPRPAGSPFRYVQLGGAFTEPPPAPGQAPRTLWYYQNGRRVRGAAEARVLQENDLVGGFEVSLVKPGGVLPGESGWLTRSVLGDGLAVGMDELAAVMVGLVVGLVVDGSEGVDGDTEGRKKVFLNRDIIRIGKALLNKRS